MTTGRDPAPDDVPAEKLRNTLLVREREAKIREEMRRRKEFDEEYGPYEESDLPVIRGELEE